MQWILGVDTSSTSIHVGLLQDGKPYLSTSRMVTNSHAEHIAPLISHFLDEAKVTVLELDGIAAVTGPGSFTGLRIGLAFLKGLAITGKPLLYPLSSFEALAATIPQGDGSFGIAFDARQEHLFYASFKKDAQVITTLESPIKLSTEQFYTIYAPQVQRIYYDTMGFSQSTTFDQLQHNPEAVNLQATVLSRGIGAAQVAYLNKDSQNGWCEAVDVSLNYMQESYAERAQKR